MKDYKQVLIVLILGFLWLTSCKDKAPEWVDENLLPNNTYWGSASAIVNGEAHVCKSAALMTDDRLDLLIQYDVLPEYRRHRISIDRLPKLEGEYLLPDRVPFWDEQPENVTFGWFSGDAVVATYQQFINGTFVLNVEHLDTLTGDISGTYSGIFVKAFPLDQVNGPDTVRIEQGVFKTKISKQ